MRCSTACPAQHVQPAVRALACLCAGHMLPAAASVHLCPTSSPHSHHSNHPNPGLHPPSPGQVQVVQPVLLRGAAQQAAAVEPGHVGLLPQLWGARHAGLGQELPAGVGGQHGGLPREGGGGGGRGAGPAVVATASMRCLVGESAARASRARCSASGCCARVGWVWNVL